MTAERVSTEDAVNEHSAGCQQTEDAHMAMVTIQEAQAKLPCGMATDTGFFSHVPMAIKATKL